MNVFIKTCSKPGLLLAMLVGIVLHAGVILAAEPEANMVNDVMVSVESLPITPTFTANVVSITEGIENFPLDRQLTNFIPFDGDFTIILAVGFTADKLKIRVEDEESYGDRLMAIAIGFNQTGAKISWGSVYSNSSSGNSFDIEIPSSPSGIVVWLWSGYQRPSVGENQYKYRITLSYPR
jgi:hypothetical protein